MSAVCTSVLFSELSNMFGPLDASIQARLRAVLENPTQETWNDAYSIIIEGRRHMTLWQAVIAVDPTFVKVGPVHVQGKRPTPWAKVPSQFTVAKALRHARLAAQSAGGR